MQVVGRKLAPVAVQVLNRRHIGFLLRPHLGSLWQLVALAQIAGRAGSAHIFPDRLSPLWSAG